VKKHSFIGCRIRRCVVAALVLFSATLFSDCGSSESGPTRYEISGKVTYARQPVPHGEIAFEPDSVKGNSGPATIAVIENGEYKTTAKKGTIGGAMIVRINGLDGKTPTDKTLAYTNPHGLELFPDFTTEIELPKENSTKDFEVPKQ